MKIAFDGLISRLGTAEERIFNFENISKETPKTEKQKKNKLRGEKDGKKPHRTEYTRSVGHSYKKMLCVCSADTTGEEKEKGTEEIFE